MDEGLFLGFTFLQRQAHMLGHVMRAQAMAAELSAGKDELAAAISKLHAAQTSQAAADVAAKERRREVEAERDAFEALSQIRKAQGAGETTFADCSQAVKSGQFLTTCCQRWDETLGRSSLTAVFSSWRAAVSARAIREMKQQLQTTFQAMSRHESRAGPDQEGPDQASVNSRNKELEALKAPTDALRKEATFLKDELAKLKTVAKDVNALKDFGVLSGRHPPRAWAAWHSFGGGVR